MKRAVFLDSDGIINRKVSEPYYVTCWEEMHILPDAAEAIPLLNQADFRVIVVTNQRCVAKGLVTTSTLESMHERMCSTLARAGATIHAIYYCPHEKQLCNCRKPAPGMLLDAARAHDIDLTASWMVGDSEADIEAGRHAGCKTVLVQKDDAMPDCEPDVVAFSLLEAAHHILQDKGR